MRLLLREPFSAKASCSINRESGHNIILPLQARNEIIFEIKKKIQLWKNQVLMGWNEMERQAQGWIYSDSINIELAVNNVNTIIAPALIGKDPIAQVQIDNYMVQELDGTKNEWGWCKQKVQNMQFISKCF